MSKQCNLPYESKFRYVIANNVSKFIKDAITIDQFMNAFLVKKSNQAVVFTLSDLNTFDENTKLLKTFLKDFIEIVKQYEYSYPQEKAKLDELKTKVLDNLNVQLDQTQIVTQTDSDTNKTQEEDIDKNTNSFIEHYKEIYGVESYELLNILKERFGDDTAKIFYFNPVTGETATRDDVILNSKIKKLKNEWFQKIIEYLKFKKVLNEDENFSMYEETGYLNFTFFDIMNMFYKHIKADKNFKSTLLQKQSEAIRQEIEAQSVDKYKSLIETIQKSEKYGEKFDAKLRTEIRLKSDRRVALSTLFESGKLSKSYKQIKDIIFEILQDSSEKEFYKNIFDSIESSEINLLDAVNAYTCITHFDELLVETYGKEITIAKGTKNLETVANKYSYKQDTSHQKKMYQHSDDNSAEKHIANMAKVVLNQIKVYNYKTQADQHRRVDSTSFIVAFRNLIDDVLYDNFMIELGGSSTEENSKAKEHFKKFIECFVKLHDDPTNNIQKILSYMFSTTEGNTAPYANKLRRTNLVSDFDLDILYSVFRIAYDKNNTNSLYNQQNKVTNKTGTSMNILLELAGFIDRNVTMHYTVSETNPETGLPKITIKRKFFNNAALRTTQLQMNQFINNKPIDERKALKNKYNFKFDIGQRSRTYSVIIGGHKLEISADEGWYILQNSKSNNGGFNRDFIDFLNKLTKAVDIIEFKDDLVKGNPLNDDQKIFKNILQFIEDSLNINILKTPNLGLQQLEVYSKIYRPKTNYVVGQHYLMPLLHLAMRAQYINNEYLNAGENDLKAYLEGQLKDKTSPDARFYKQKKQPFITLFEKVNYKAITYQDEVLQQWMDAYSILTGEASKATTKDMENNSIPNNGINKMGTMLPYYLEKQKGGKASGQLLLTQQPSLLKRITHDLEVVSWLQESKSVKSMSVGELYFHSIFNKFWGHYLDTGNVYIQPTNYADKTTFLQYEIDATKLEQDILRSKSGYDSLTLYEQYLGNFYKNSYEHTKNKLNLIKGAYNIENPENQKSTYKEVLAECTGNELVKLAQKIGIELEQDKDYRVIKNSNGKEMCVVNELLEYYGDSLYKNTKKSNSELNKVLQQQRIIFIKNLIDSNLSLQVLNFNQNHEDFTKKVLPEQTKRFNTPILNIILKYFENKYEDRKEFFENWVDKKTGQLILAKQEGNNILDVSSDWDENTYLDQVNPFLDKFFYIGGFLQNSIRMNLTGSEVNHPDKAFNTPYNKLKKDLSEAAEAKEVLEQYAINNNISSDSRTINGAIKILKNSNYIGDLKGSSNAIIDKIYKETMLEIANTAQVTQFKRNVIIPATLQYCQQGVFEGITDKIKICTIKDEKASVYNYRGDHEKDIDSSDGNAKITAFQSILENRCLGSQAVGFTKKPIWHHYDADAGDCFLAKFAVETITNATMLRSMQSSTSLFNLFKKMTNLHWEDSIDLTRTIIPMQEDREKEWFEVQMLGNSIYEGKYTSGNRLLYKNKHGKIISIDGFGRTNIQKDNSYIYYTLESNYSPQVRLTQHQVYHIFYDDVDPITGKVVKSIHKTFDTYQQAVAWKKENSKKNVHTIKSLFELHQALGGIYCCDTKGETSEFNNEVVVNFMCNVGSYKGNVKQLDQAHVNQPLKQYQIGYALNNTAVKQGAKNINPASSWYDDEELTYFEVDSAGLGIQMNADHEIINSELTEFSQVIAATSAYGYLQDNTSEIFKSLGKTALQSSYKVITAVDNYIQAVMDGLENVEELKSDLYDAVGRIILVGGSIHNEENLTSVVKDAILKTFNKHKNHIAYDEKLIPFSDNNLYSDFLATLVSTINKESIKRQHPGSGCVIAPAYNVIQYFEVDGKKLFTPQIIKQALKQYKLDLINLLQDKKTDPTLAYVVVGGDRVYLKELTAIEDLERALKHFKIENTSKYFTDTSDLHQFNKHLINTYLQSKQDEIALTEDYSWYMPSDIVNITDTEGNVLKTIDLDSLDKYYKFKDGLDTSELANNVIIKPNYKNSKFSIIDNATKQQFDIYYDSDKKRYVLEYNGEIPKNVLNAISDIIPINNQLELLGNIVVPDIIQGCVRIDNPSIEDKSIIFEKRTSISYSEYKYQNNIIRPHNLRPSLIRWQYAFGDSVRYMNIFDSPVIKNAYINPKAKDAKHRTLVQDELHRIVEEYKFTAPDGNYLDIIPDTLENSAAELVMSNLYKETFGIGDEDVQEIIDQGEDYFFNKTKKVEAPQHLLYDIAFLKESGNHTLISLSNVHPSSTVQLDNFKDSELQTSADGSIHLVKGNKKICRVGQWVNVSGVHRDGEVFKDKNGNVLEPSNYYRYNESTKTFQKRIDIVTRYKVTQISKSKIGQIYYNNTTLYNIAHTDVVQNTLLENPNKTGAYNRISKIITDLYKSQDYLYAEINSAKVYTESQQKDFEAKFYGLKEDRYINEDVRNLLQQQLNTLTLVSKDELNRLKKLANRTKKSNKEDVDAVQKNLKTLINESKTKYQVLKEEFYKKQAHKKYISFLDSLNFIASRIPAQTLQSFMAMKCIGWTGNINNQAYVSHFQTYLQGSDYDIDKAYIMGQSYNDNATYVGWSDLFDYTSYETLQASKQLPVPKQITINLSNDVVEDGADISKLVNAIVPYLNSETSQDKVKFLENIRKLILVLEKHGGIGYYKGYDNKILTKLQTLLNSHEYTKIPIMNMEQAYKNVASANIYAVSHDIRNRDQAYTAVTMQDLQDIAGETPKGKKSAQLNMFNPLTVYTMQHQNLIGKQVIGIAANGEKAWFNMFYYWTEVLKNGTQDAIDKLKFSHTFKRIQGRFTGNIDQVTLNCIPDLNARDEQIKNLLLSQFDISPNDYNYKYVDQLISQLLSAATDNAKELILDKINAGTNFAKMYVQGIIMGFNLDDLVAFMTSPVAELIDKEAYNNIFSITALHNSPYYAINFAKGRISSSKFLHGKIKQLELDTETGEYRNTYINKTSYLLKKIKNYLEQENNKDLLIKVREKLDMQPDVNGNYPELESLDDALQGLILVYSSELKYRYKDIQDIFKNEADTEINRLARHCANSVLKLKKVIGEYTSYQDYIDDVDEFDKLHSLANETSTIASAYLGLNQGIPTRKVELLKKLRNMTNLVLDRENYFGIKDSELFIKETPQDMSQQTKKSKKFTEQDAANNRNKLIDRLVAYNNTLNRDKVEKILNLAHENNLINNFNIVEYLRNSDYRELAKEYYSIIMGTTNVFAMLENLPHYDAILKCLNSVVIADQTLSSKSRLINKILDSHGKDVRITDEFIQGAINYADSLKVLEFTKSLDIIPTKSKENENGEKVKVKGFDREFNEIDIDYIDLSSLNGLASFKHWVENEFYYELTQGKLKNNGAVQHLIVSSDNDKALLTFDIDLMNPNVTSTTREIYDTILRGLYELQDEYYNNSEYSYADIMQLYNLVVNLNKYGKERLTTTFKVCDKPKNIINRWLNYTGDIDAGKEQEFIELNYLDYLIMSAPLISAYEESFHNEPFVKVKDQVRGYIIKRRVGYGDYKEEPLITIKSANINSEVSLKQKANFYFYCPFEMPNYHNQMYMSDVLLFKNSELRNEETKKDIWNKVYSLIQTLSISSKIKVYKQC